jgi:ATP-binding cassette subfamily C protein
MNHATGPAQQQPVSSELAAALGACRRAFVATAAFSGMSNLLMLTGALFMLEVYDRILPSRSVPTLVALLFLVAGLYAAQGIIDTIRSRILVRVGHSLDESMSARVYDAIIRLPLKIGAKSEGTQPIRDLDTVRGFLSGTGPVAFFDLPWMPVYLAICFLFHTYIGLTALFGAIVLVILTLITEVKTRHPTRSAAQFAVARNALLEASRRNAEAITAMGMVGRTAKRWHDLNRNYVITSGRASDVGGGLGAASKVLRLLLQSAILAVGAWLVIQSAVNTWNHHRRFDLGWPRSGAGRFGNCQLARIRRRSAKLAASIQITRPFAAAIRSDVAETAGAYACRSERRGCAARSSKDRLPGGQFHACRG